MANQRRVRCSGHNGLNRFNRHFCVSLQQMTAAFLGGVSFRLTCNSATTKKRSEFASCWFRHDLPTLDRFFFFIFICSASLHQPSVWKSSSHSSSSSSSESVAPTGLTCSTWRKRKNLKKRLSEARVAKKSKTSDTVPAGSGSVGVDEEFERGLHACRLRKPKKLQV